MPHPIDALISDCDGVLVDSEVIAERVMYEALSAYAPLEELQRLLEGTFGLTSRDILDRVEKHFGLRIPDSFNREVRQRSEEMVAQVQPIPGAREALLALDLPVAVASNSRRHSLERSLARAGLSELIGERLASADMVALPKPAPDVYLHAASLLGVAPERCLGVEDSSTGTRAALAAGMRVIGFVGAGHIPAGHAEVLRELGAIAIVEHMRELPETVARLRRESRVTLGTP
ncbi:HAD family hydrolase [Pseudomonas aeruginosa]|nr:HAD family hydrolase [Pseudomonas aeruginosa]